MARRALEQDPEGYADLYPRPRPEDLAPSPNAPQPVEPTGPPPLNTIPGRPRPDMSYIPTPAIPAAPPQPNDDGGGRDLDRILEMMMGLFRPQQPQTNPALDKLLAQIMENQTRAQREQAARAEEDKAYRARIRGSTLSTIERASRFPSLQDPNIAARIQAFSGEGERALQMGSERVAARRGARGLPQGAADAAIESGYENLGESRGAYSANLLSDAYTQNRAELMGALNLGAGILSDDEDRNLRATLGAIDAELGQLGLRTSASTAGRGQDISALLGLGGLSNQRYGLNLNNTQFYDQLAYNTQLQEALLNQALMQQLLGGA